MKYNIIVTLRFRKEQKQMKKRGADLDKLKNVIGMLADGTVLPERYHDHELTGNFKGYRECHVSPDWLLIYRIFEDKLILTLERTGTHSDLF